MPEEIRESAGSEAAQPMVLVVDDDVETLWALQRALRSEPYWRRTTPFGRSNG